MMKSMNCKDMMMDIVSFLFVLFLFGAFFFWIQVSTLHDAKVGL